MKALVHSWLVAGALLCATVPTGAQSRAGALALDEQQGDQYGWAVDYETPAAARAAALSECGAGCSVVLTFNRCGAYAADQDADNTAVGWAESYTSADGARQAALAACRSRGGSGCIVRVWGCNGPVVEEALGLDQAARRQIQEGLEAAGFDPGVADGVFGPRTRAAIRRWQSSRDGRPTGYLESVQVEALRDRGRSQPPATASPPASATSSAEVEVVFWQSIVNSTNPADFEAYLGQFPNGAFRPLAENRLTALRATAGGARPSASGTRVSRATTPASDSRVGGTPAADIADARPQPRAVFRDCEVCPEMVVMPDGRLALGRYEVTVGEYRAFAAAGGAAPDRGSCDIYGEAGSWRNTIFFDQTGLHPVVCVSWHDAQAYVAWLSQRTGVRYRLPTAVEWDRAAVGSHPGCGDRYQRMVDHREGTCRVGSYGVNGAGLADMVGNVGEWVEDCYDAECRYRSTRSVGFVMAPEYQRYDRRGRYPAEHRTFDFGFRVARTIRAP